MRGFLGSYLAIGILFLLIGLFATGPCPDKNRDIVSNTVFVLGWPVYLYHDVAQGADNAPQFLHRQTCGGGVVAYGDIPPPRDQNGSSSPMSPRDTINGGSDR
jgi:hypothetical protein